LSFPFASGHYRLAAQQRNPIAHAYQGSKVGIDPDAVLPDQAENPPQDVTHVNARAVPPTSLPEELDHVTSKGGPPLFSHVVLEGEAERELLFLKAWRQHP
jgi:hypothetical protein